MKNLKNNHRKQKNKKKKETESHLVRDCLNLLARWGYLALRNNSGLIVIKEHNKTRAVKMGTKGSADIIACSPTGKFVAIECKTSKGKLTKHQQEFLNKVQSLGGIALIVKNIEELKNFLQ